MDRDAYPLLQGAKMIEEFEDVELPPEDPNEWKECPSCTMLKKEIEIYQSVININKFDKQQEEIAKLKTAITVLSLDLEVAQMHLEQARAQIFELNKDAEYTIKVLKERQMLRLALDKIKHKTTVYQSAGHVCDAKVDNDAIHQIAKAALGEK